MCEAVKDKTCIIAVVVLVLLHLFLVSLFVASILWRLKPETTSDRCAQRVNMSTFYQGAGSGVSAAKRHHLIAHRTPLLRRGHLGVITCDNWWHLGRSPIAAHRYTTRGYWQDRTPLEWRPLVPEMSIIPRRCAGHVTGSYTPEKDGIGM